MSGHDSHKQVNLALQGGGAHGAFTWGVLDKLLEDGRLVIEGVSATSAGAMNAAVYAYGKMTGGADGARQALHDFWHHISTAAALYSPVKAIPWEKLWPGAETEQSWSFQVFDTWTRMFSPYQINPLNFNPLRTVLANSIDFDQLKTCDNTHLFISATNVRTGKLRVFRNQEITLDVVLASACLPFLFQAVEIRGSFYWDGGYMGNPALYPLYYHTQSNDIVIVHINPIYSDDIPRTALGITNRANEIAFNSSLLQELRAIAFVTKLLDEGWIKDEYRSQLHYMLVHSVQADEALAHLSAASKFNCDWNFLTDLRDRGRGTAEQWLAENYIHVGKRTTVDVREEFLNP